jgi:dTDP-4-amino-4,6-dideoxygalactose transaminase
MTPRVTAADLAARVPPVVGREPVRFLQPQVPALADAARYYALAEEAAFYSNGGPCHELLRGRLSERLRGAHVLPVANCTLGLMVALRAALGEPTGTRSLVVTPSFTFTATACAIVWAGFEPLFVDIEPASWQMDHEALATALDEQAGRIAGVLGCSTFGTAPPVRLRDAWRAACREHGVPLLLDSASGFGSVDAEGVPVGGLGETEIFSFHATKPFAIGEGGAIATPDPALAERAGRLINFGMERGARSSDEAGINAKLSELHCAIALSMLDRYDDTLAERRATAARLRTAIAQRHARVSFQRGVEDSTIQTCQIVAADAESRSAMVDRAAQLDVQARAYFDPPVHRQPAFQRWTPAAALPVTDDIAARSLSLPMANRLPDEHIERIADVTVPVARMHAAA